MVGRLRGESRARTESSKPIRGLEGEPPCFLLGFGSGAWQRVNILPTAVRPCGASVTESHTVSRVLTRRPGLPSPGCLSKVAAQLTIGFPSAPPPTFLSSPEGNNAASCGERLGFLGLEGVRVLSYDPLPVWPGPAVITPPGSRALSRELGSSRCWGGPPSLAAAQGWETWGDSCLPLQQMFLIFFFSSMETLNHISAFPVIYISHDS